jgi:hypothetical protein
MTLEVVRDHLLKELRGSRLQNGALCIASAVIRDGQAVVLAFRDHPVDPYVVWYSNFEGMCSQGTYCTTLADAAKEFDRRAGVQA